MPLSIERNLAALEAQFESQLQNARRRSRAGNDAESGISDIRMRRAEVDPVKKIECRAAKLQIQSLQHRGPLGQHEVDRLLPWRADP